MKPLFRNSCILFLSLSGFMFFTDCTKKTDKYDYQLFTTRVYKTRGDYYKNVHTWGNDNGPTCYSLESGLFITIVGTDTVCATRWRLDDNYVMERDICADDYFTNMTYAELAAYHISHPDGPCYPIESMLGRVIDENPFLEFYDDENNIFYHRDSSDIAQINKLIRDGELEKYFKKIK
jgi:hypothetical protein